jgi:hypothetical protein
MLGPQYRPTAVGRTPRRTPPIANSVVKGEAGVAFCQGASQGSGD